MNRCQHGVEIHINETYSKVYSSCKLCNQEYEKHRALERLMDKYPNSYQYCSNPECNYIFSNFYKVCHKCESAPEEISL